MTSSPDKPYNDLPLLPPLADLETVPVLKAVAKAGRALAELKGRTHTLPNPAIITDTISLQEAKASSEIENIFTTNDELYRALSHLEDFALSPHAKEVLNYKDALWGGAKRLDVQPVFTTNMFIEVVEIIKQANIGIRCQPRAAINNDSTGKTVYTPPEGESVIRNKLANLEVFCNEPSDLDPLVKMAVMHYQFEAIHPFYDGNGRTGRILIILYLYFEQLLDQPILYLSRYIIENKSEYYRSLRLVTEEQNWEQWLLYLLKAVEEVAKETSNKITAICDLIHTFTEEAKKAISKKAYSKELVDLLFAQPYCKIKFVEEAGIAKRVTASRYLHEFSEHGLVTAQKSANEMLFINHRLLKLLK